MSFTSQDYHKKSFRIKHEDEKIFTKFLSKESSKSKPSFRNYYSDVPSAVPFVWETRPGTPKNGVFRENIDVPPLTPPPSYYNNINLNTTSTKNSKPKIFLQTLLTRINHKKSSLSSSSSSLSSSYSSFRDQVSSKPINYRRRRFSRWGGETAVDDRRDQGFEKKKKKFHGYNSSVYVVKKVFFAIVGPRSSAYSVVVFYVYF